MRMRPEAEAEDLVRGRVLSSDRVLGLASSRPAGLDSTSPILSLTESRPLGRDEVRQASASGLDQSVPTPPVTSLSPK